MNRKQEIAKDLSMLIDAALLGFCFWICHLLRSTGLVRLDILWDIPPFDHSDWMLILIVLLSPVLLNLNGFYDKPLSQRYEVLLIIVARSGFWLFLIISLFAIFGRLEVPSRSVLILFLVLAPLFLMFRVVITRKSLVHNYQKGKIGERSALVGKTDDAEAFLKKLSLGEKLELQINQRLDIETLDARTITAKIRQHGTGRVIFVSPESPLNGDLPSAFDEEGLDVWIVSSSIHGIEGTPSVAMAGSNRVLVFGKSPSHSWQLFAKRTIDIVGSIAGLVLLSPLFLIIAILIKCTSPGPVIFRQVRSGRRGRQFTILKFRSMVANAPELHAGLSGHNEMEGPVFKIAADPRVTPLGAFLRRTSLDEIPQLLNVLRGEMSLVGPRPLPDYETALIEKGTHRRRLSVKPGLTCLWQIRGRNSISNFDEWVQLDIEYIDRASLLLDLWIILRTVPAVLFRKGAH